MSTIKSGQVICPFISQLSDAQQQQWLALLNKAMPLLNIVPNKQLSSADKKQCTFAIVANPSMAQICEYSGLVWVQSLWAGVENLIGDELTANISIVRLVDPMLTKTMAEAVLAWTLYLHRDMPAYAKQQLNKQWHQHQYTPAERKNVGVLGLGTLGKPSATLLAEHGFNVLGWSRHQKNIEGIECYAEENGLNHVLKQVDILICLLPLTTSTENLLNNERLTLLKSKAQLINFSRAGVIDYSAVMTLLEKQHIKHAVLDVFDQEPLPEDHALWSHTGVTILPHISAPTYMDSAVETVTNNINSFINTGNIPSSVDKYHGY